MNIPLQILGRSIRLIVAEPLRTLTVIAPGALLYGIAGGLLFLSFAQGAGPEGSDTIENVPLLILAIAVLVLGWMSFAILWHRHALLEGAARTQVMRPGSAVYGLYFRCALMIGLIMVVLALGGGMAVGIVSLILVTALGPALGQLASVGVFMIFLTGLSWVLLRISLILPAAAMGQPMTYSDSWQATQRIARDVFWTAVLLAILNTVMEQLAIGLATALPGYALIFDVTQLVISALLYVSVLSTLYGHLVQGRALS
ncbi:hypothetical protein [uncultured Roseobacter sp.]|uniref:hypothetical protein n=1 Tax=uncultured Roseobacter sp. TaxID=114847 RepID=UPI00262B3052|nr:hypothetical protein [uncultured Roseobacter sp.]